MTPAQYLRLEEIIQTFEETGGEAAWNEIRKRITNKRGDSYVPYLNWLNFNTTMFQLVQQHCEGYEKFIGPVYFEKVRRGRFRLVKGRLAETITSAYAGQSKPASDILTPVASDISEPPQRVQTELYRVLRDTKLTREIKIKHGYKCQICESPPLRISDTTLYAEVHHIKPLGSPHDGPDIEENIVCVCPNCHVLLDYGATALDIDKLVYSSAHKLGKEYIDYHNYKIFGKVRTTG